MKKIIIILFLVIVLNPVLTLSAAPAFSAKLLGGFPVYYGLSTDAAKRGWTSIVDDAVKSWTGSVSGVTAKNTGIRNDSQADFYHSTSVNGYANASTSYTFAPCTSNLNPNNCNWVYTNVTIYGNLMVANKYSRAAKQGVIAHEFGHVLGLKDFNTSPYSIMCQAGSGRKVTVPSTDDKKTIKNKY
ncbi:MAG: reprolysin-like metallopeptidase [Mycoplasmatales bacterium]